MRVWQIPAMIMVIGLSISGCNLAGSPKLGGGPQAVFTAAAQTLEAQLTQVVIPDTTSIATVEASPVVTAAAPISAAPVPTASPIPAGSASSSDTPACDSARFIADVTIPDGTILNGSEGFTKTWRFANTGSCSWNPSYTLIFDTGDSMGGPASIPMPANVPPGGQVDLSANLQAPSDSGRYRGYWRLRNPAGEFLTLANGYKSKSVYVDIQVKNGGARPDFAVTSVHFTVSHSGLCSSGTYTVTAKVATNGAGDVSYNWGRSDGVSGSLNSGTLTFSGAETQSISYDWASGATGLSMTLYIDTPNHQNFGTALLNCP